MINKTINKVENGINIKFTGSIEKSSIENMIDECSSGNCQCDCDPNLIKQIEKMSVDGKDGDVTLSLKGKSLDKDEIEKAVNGCIIG